MAIYQRDRNFYRIFSEVDVDVVPLKFIKDITCILGDGSTVVLDSTDFSKEPEDSDLETMIKGLSFYEQVADLKILIDYEKVEQDVESEVAKLLRDK